MPCNKHLINRAKSVCMGGSWPRSCVQTSVKILPCRPPARLIRANFYSFKTFPCSCCWQNLERHLSYWTYDAKGATPCREYWINLVKMTSKVQPSADYCTVDQENLGTRLCYVKLPKAKELIFSFRSLKIFWINNKAIIKFGFHRVLRILQISECRPLALVDNTLLDLQNSSYPTQPH